MRIKQSLFIFIFTFSIFTHSTQAETTRIMLLGDSITYDWLFSDMLTPRPASILSSYRNDLWYKLQDAQYDVDFVGSRSAGWLVTPSFDTDNEGYTGYTAEQIASLVYGKLVQNQADIILLHIGSNDWSSSTSGLEHILDEIDRYERDYAHHITVILARIIDMTPRYSWITNYNTNLQTLADNRNTSGDDIVVVDMQNSAGLIYTIGIDFADYIHPNDSGYNKMAEVWFRAIKDVLNRQNGYAWLIPIYSLIL